MSWVSNRKNYQDVARSIHPGALLVTKDSWFFKVIALVPAIFVGYTYWMEHYALAIGPLQAYPKQWLDLKTGTIIHECGHSRQCEILGWFIPVIGWFFGKTVRTWAGLPLFLILYFLVFLPVGLAVFRCWFELDADRHKWRWMLNQGYPASSVRSKAISLSSSVNGKGYGFSFPWLGRKWIIAAAEKVIRNSRK